MAIFAAGAGESDAGTGADAPGSFAAAARVAPVGRFLGTLSSVQDEDWFRFEVAAGVPIDIEVGAGLVTGSLQTGDSLRRPGVHLYDPNGLLLDTPNSNIGDARVTWPAAHIAGDYRLRLDGDFLGARSYWFCFVVDGASCITPGVRPIEALTPLSTVHANVLLVPPTMSNPAGPETALDYLDATLRGIRQWDGVIDRFVAEHPQYAYLQELTVHVEVFDGVAPQRVGYDVVVVWAPYTGPIFRGLAVTFLGPGPMQSALCGWSVTCPLREQLEPYVHDSTRLIVMSQFGSAPRGGQVMPDFPEAMDVYNVAMHEFAHTWGLGHTQTYTTSHGPDLMNSPYTDVFGDGHPISDGQERTPAYCVSSLDLYGMARLYEWVGQGKAYHQRTPLPATVALPAGMPYKLYC